MGSVTPVHGLNVSASPVGEMAGTETVRTVVAAAAADDQAVEQDGGGGYGRGSGSRRGGGGGGGDSRWNHRNKPCGSGRDGGNTMRASATAQATKTGRSRGNPWEAMWARGFSNEEEVRCEYGQN